MTLSAKTGLLALGACMALAAQASADAPDPLEQIRQGAEPREVVCGVGFELAISPDGSPACVSPPSAEVLESRGWELVLQSSGSDTVSGKSEGGDGRFGDRTISAPQYPLMHQNTTLELSKYPVVGEVAELTAITEYGDEPPEFYDSDGYPLVKIGVTSGQPDRYRVFDIVANIETGDEDTFAPYDFETTTVVAEPEVVYIVKAKLEILREGVAHIAVRGFDGDILSEHVAASREKSMSYQEYVDTGQTYLDALWAAEAAAFERLQEEGVEYPDDPPPAEAVEDMRSAEEIEREWFAEIAQDYAGTEHTETDVARDMLDLSYGEDEVRHFLVDYMGYAPELVDKIDMHDVLASLYESYEWRYSWGEDEIIRDLLNRGYTNVEIREFFIERLEYAPDQADRLDIKKVLAKFTAWYVVDMLQLWGYADDEIREFFIEYAGYTEQEAQAVIIDTSHASAQEMPQAVSGQQKCSVVM